MSAMQSRYPTLQRRWSMVSRMQSFDRSPTLKQSEVVDIKRMQSFDHSPTLKQSEVVDIKSTDQWRAYFDASKGNNKLLVIQFTATWCGPCRFIDPAVKEFAAKYTDVEFIKIDVDKFMMVADRFQANSLPAFVLIKKGKEVDRIVGAKKMELQNKIEQHKI